MVWISRIVLAATLTALFVSCSEDAAPFEFIEGAPADVGMDATVLEGARTYAFADGRNTQAVVVVRGGTVVAEWYADNRGPEDRGSSWSVGKSFTSALIGIAIDRGEIPSVDAPMTTWFPEFVGTDKENMTLRDVLEMASGIEWSESYNPMELTSSDVIEMVLDVDGSHLDIVTDNPVSYPHGTRFNYSSGDTMLLSHVIGEATGMRADEYAERYLFEPLGITEGRWWRDRAGDTLTYCCVDLTARQFARFGELYLRGGALGGRRVLSESWVNDSVAESRSYRGYGFQWWLTGNTNGSVPADLYSARGHDGQYIYVIPSLDLVVVRIGIYNPPWMPDGVVDPSLYAEIPSDGIFPRRGTLPPNSWRDADFLAPIVASIQ